MPTQRNLYWAKVYNKNAGDDAVFCIFVFCCINMHNVCLDAYYFCMCAIKMLRKSYENVEIDMIRRIMQKRLPS